MFRYMAISACVGLDCKAKTLSTGDSEKLQHHLPISRYDEVHMGVIHFKTVCVRCFFGLKFHDARNISRARVGHCLFQCRRVGLKMTSVQILKEGDSCDAAQKMNGSHCVVKGICRMFASVSTVGGSNPSKNVFVITELYAVTLYISLHFFTWMWDLE
jgi:hypothetical protein